MIKIPKVTPLHNWFISYIVAASLIGLVLACSLILNQVALHRESVSRGAAALEARQSVRSEQIVYDAIWLTSPTTNHAPYLKQIQSDIDAMEVDRLFLNANYLPYYKTSFSHIDSNLSKAVNVYFTVRTTALDLLATENRLEHESSILQAHDNKQALNDIKTLFIVQPEQLSNIQQAQAIIEKDTNSYIASLSGISIASFVLGGLALLYVGFFMIRPATVLLKQQLKQ